MKHAYGMVVHLDDDDVCGRLARDAREFIRGSADGRVQYDPLSRARQRGLAETFQLSPHQISVGAGAEVGRTQRLQDEMSKGRGLDDMNDVQLRIVYGPHQVARRHEDVLADIAQVYADDDHHMAPGFALSCFDHDLSKPPKRLWVPLVGALFVPLGVPPTTNDYFCAAIVGTRATLSISVANAKSSSLMPPASCVVRSTTTRL